MPLSGGVDSSVSLNLLLQQGYDATAFYLKVWLEDEFAHLGEDRLPLGGQLPDLCGGLQARGVCAAGDAVAA